MTYDQLPPHIDDVASAEADVPLPDAETEAPSISRQYRQVLYGGIAAYFDQRAQRQAQQAEQAAEFTTLTDKLGSVYAVHQHLDPENLTLVKDCEDEFRSFTDTTQPPVPTPESRLQQLAEENPTPPHRREWAGRIAGAVAAASVRQYSGGGTHKEYRDLLYQPKARHPEVQRRASKHLLDNLGLFRMQSLRDLNQVALAVYDLTPDDLENYAKLREALSDENTPSLRLFTAPPLHLTQLAADIRNDNPGSVLPYGLHTRLSGRRQPEGIKELATQVVSAHDAYLLRRYDYDWMPRPNRQTLDVLAECDLAERQGFLGAPREAQTRTVNRVYDYNHTFVKAKPELLHPEARVIFDEITRLHRSSALHPYKSV